MKDEHRERIAELTREIAAANERTQELLAERDAVYLAARSDGAKFPEIAAAAGCRKEAVSQRLRKLERERGLPKGVLG